MQLFIFFIPLNEGRGVNPSDTCISSPCRSGGNFGAQRRPGRKPQRHFVITTLVVLSSTLAQRRPGRKPQRHFVITTLVVLSSTLAQRRPGRKPQRHKSTAKEDHTRALPLNEGRGVNPSDTQETGRLKGLEFIAQRRPGRKPQRHMSWLCGCSDFSDPLNEGRGVNPSDTFKEGRLMMQWCGAQRRPGRKPQRHNIADYAPQRHAARSTKAGA